MEKHHLFFKEWRMLQVRSFLLLRGYHHLECDNWRTVSGNARSCLWIAQMLCHHSWPYCFYLKWPMRVCKMLRGG